MTENEIPICKFFKRSEMRIQCRFIDQASIRQATPSAMSYERGYPMCLPAYSVIFPPLVDVLRGKEVPIAEKPNRIAATQKSTCDMYDSEKQKTDYVNPQPSDLRRTERSREFSQLLNLEDLRPGVTITDFRHITDLDAFNDFIMQTISNNTGTVRKRRSSPLSKKIVDNLRKKGFNGSFEDIQATILINHLVNPTSVSTNDLFRYIATIGMYSTGRGIIATYVSEIGIVKQLATEEDFRLALFARNLSGAKGVAAIDYLLNDAQVNWAASRRESLHRVVSAGLPSLGKKR